MPFMAGINELEASRKPTTQTAHLFFANKKVNAENQRTVLFANPRNEKQNLEI